MILCSVNRSQRRGLVSNHYTYTCFSTALFIFSPHILLSAATTNTITIMMKHIRVQSIALFLAGIAAAASQQVEPSASGVSNTLCSSVPFVKIGNDATYICPIHPIEDCLALTQVDKDNMILHIRALNEVFLQS